MRSAFVASSLDGSEQCVNQSGRTISPEVVALKLLLRLERGFAFSFTFPYKEHERSLSSSLGEVCNCHISEIVRRGQLAALSSPPCLLAWQIKIACVHGYRYICHCEMLDGISCIMQSQLRWWLAGNHIFFYIKTKEVI